MHTKEDVDRLAMEFEQCRKILVALGDENRQHMILEMIKIGDCRGVRVNQITEKTHLSRPAVSHHLRILKDAGILKMRREATKNYYYFDPDMKSFELLTDFLQKAISITSALPDRSQRAEDGINNSETKL